MANNKEHLFENTFLPDKIFLAEVCKHSYPVGFKVFCFTCFPLLILWVLIAVLFEYDIDTYIILIFLVSIFGLFCPTIRIHYDTAQLMKRFNTVETKAEKTFITKFYEESLCHALHEAIHVIEYKQITNIISSKNGLYIVIKKKIVPIKKDAFTKGDYESFVVFMKEKLKGNRRALRGLK
jgi:hypothetical protein